MTEIVLHFEADSDVDVAALAAALQARSAELPGVEAAVAEGNTSRSLLPDILLVLTVGTTLLQTSALTLEALKHFIDASKGVADSLGLRNAKVEVGMTRVAPDALTPAHAAEISAG